MLSAKSIARYPGLFFTLLLASVTVCYADEDHAFALETTTLVKFDATIGEQPNGMTRLKNGLLAMSFPFLNELRIYNPVTGAHVKTINNLPSMTGLATDVNGDILAAAVPVLFDPDNIDQQGIWRIPIHGGEATLIAAMPPTSFAARIAVLPSGQILVADLTGARIFSITENDEAVVWLEDPLLAGSLELPGPVGRPPFPIGIEGIQFHNDFLYGVVADFGRLVRIAINPDGSAAAIEVVLEDPELLLGLAQFTFDSHGNIYGISGFQSELYRITPDREIAVLANSQDGLDTPAGIVRGQGKLADKLFVTNFAFITKNAGGDANAGLLQISDVIAEDKHKDQDVGEKNHHSHHSHPFISAEFPFESKFVEVNGVRMHYIEAGKGTPILFIHSIPTHTYLWRNVIPHVAKSGRAIAMDLAGFGRSETPPESSQTYAIQTQYVDGFIDKLGLDEVILVVHDWGGFPGLDWAARHPNRIRGLVFMEVLVDVIQDACFFLNCEPFPIPPWTSTEVGQQLIVENNLFADVLPMATVQPLTSEILNNYTQFFDTPARRQIYLDLESDLPVIGENRPDSLHRATRYAKWLQESSTPKLLFYATPGFAIREDNGMLDKALRARNVTSIDLGVGIHFLQESHPHKIGHSIRRWIHQQRLNKHDHGDVKELMKN